MRKIKKSFKVLCEYCRNNLMLVALVIAAVVNDFILRGLTVGNVFKIKPIITSMATIVLFSIIAIVLANKKRKYFYIIFSWVFTLLNMANFMYYTYFKSFLSISFFNQVAHLSKMKSSVSEAFNIKVLIFIIPTLALMYFYRRLKQKNYFERVDDQYSLRHEIRTPFVFSLVLFLAVSVTLTGTDISRIQKQWNRDYLVEQFGIYSFVAADVVKAATVQKPVEGDFEKFDERVNNLVQRNQSLNQNNKYTNSLEGKDLYVIHYESVQSFAMDLSFADGEVTPFLNKLADESLFFSNFHPQISVGTSSDTEFTFNTSLYPINNRTVFIDHADKEFESLQKLLKEKGYYTMSMHGNNGSFWNRDMMHPNLGYEEFVSKEAYEIDEVTGMGLSDESFYRQSVEKIKQKKLLHEGPMMVKLITLSNHYPFKDLDFYGPFDTGYLEGTDVSNYLKSMNYADRALETFFMEMEKAGLLDNAAILIYGDHHSNVSTEDYEKIYNYDSKKNLLIHKSSDNFKEINNAYLRDAQRTPLLIWTKDGALKETIDKPTGMIDVMPTLGNMMNFKNTFGLGQDIINEQENSVIFPDGSFLTEDYYYSASTMEVFDMKTNQLLFSEKDLPQEILEEIQMVEDELELSTDLIENNLINHYKSFIQEGMKRWHKV